MKQNKKKKPRKTHIMPTKKNHGKCRQNETKSKPTTKTKNKNKKQKTKQKFKRLT